MNLRRLAPEDIPQLSEIDGTIDSREYFHVSRTGEGVTLQFSLEIHPLRERAIQPNRLGDELNFLIRQIVSGADEGLALVAEHDSQIVALLLGQMDMPRSVLKIFDLRVDHDFRRQGLGAGLIFQAIQFARDNELRAVMMETKTNNLPAARLLQKYSFEIAGLDTQHQSNHDLVKESVTLFWYAALS